jgi:acetyl esterase/lipase
MIPPFHRFLLIFSLSFLCCAPLAAQEKAAPLPPTFADVRYGPYDRNVLDVYQAKTEKPAPVLIHFHGGGWIRGDKKGVAAAPMVRGGVTVVSANYRFTTGTKDAAPYPAPMLDSARVVQFVRSKAAEWHIDPTRIALTGSSAGAVISMWIAYRDDMAKPDSSDPVERQSTRVTCIVPMAGPTTLDPKIILKSIGGNPDIHPAMLPFFNVKAISELEAPDKQKVIAEASPITHVTKDDPPTLQIFTYALGDTPLPPNAEINHSIHHPEFGVLLKEKLDAAGVENALQSKDDGSNPKLMVEFLVKHLKPVPPAP